MRELKYFLIDSRTFSSADASSKGPAFGLKGVGFDRQDPTKSSSCSTNTPGNDCNIQKRRKARSLPSKTGPAAICRADTLSIKHRSAYNSIKGISRKLIDSKLPVVYKTCVASALLLSSFFCFFNSSFSLWATKASFCLSVSLAISSSLSFFSSSFSLTLSSSFFCLLSSRFRTFSASSIALRRLFSAI